MNARERATSLRNKWRTTGSESDPVSELEASILAAEQAARADERRKTLVEAALFVDEYKKDQPETVSSIGLRFHLAQGIRALAGKKEGA